MRQSAYCAISMGGLRDAGCDGAAGGGIWSGAPWAEAGPAGLLVGGALLFALALGLLLLVRHQWQSVRRDGARVLQEQVREAERRRIGHDIHDDLGQHLLALKMECCTLRRHLPQDATALHGQVDLISGHLDLTLTSLRCVINALRPPALCAGLDAALAAQLADFSRIHGLRHTLDAAPDACAAAAPHAVLLFRLTQEALSNIARHAGARQVAVTLRLRGDARAGELMLTIADDGVGLPASGFRRGCGLAGMEERSAAAGGCFRVSSEAGLGTVLTLALPLGQAASATVAA